MAQTDKGPALGADDFEHRNLLLAKHIYIFVFAISGGKYRLKGVD